MENLTLYSAFFAGVLSFLSPCVLPLLPGYISFISGESIESLTSSDSKAPRAKAFLGAVFFGIGFTMVFVLLGASATELGKMLNQYRIVLEKVAGIVVIILGIHMIGIFKINKLLVQKKWNYKKGKAPFYLEAFLLGVAFVFGWTPCIGPILAGILALASKQETVLNGIYLLTSYSLGLWIPFLISALALGTIISFIRRAGKFVVWVERISGVMLVFIGILMLTGSLTIIVSYIADIFPWLIDFAK
ncbi:MAG: cytochrome c-type biosis protein [Deferribacteres bacterium]|jgi:cytochrome c-type biogenesis protein|nr:cytochrome c-type biosis protein [Deferribacteres bacterium]